MSDIHADVSVRPAVAGDEVVIANIQLAAWARLYGETVGEDFLLALNSKGFSDRWLGAIQAQDRDSHVLVAMKGPLIVGFASLVSGEIQNLEVVHQHQRNGHGSRLLAACADHVRARSGDTLQIWVNTDEDSKQRFLTDAGFGPSGTQRNFELPVGEDAEPQTTTEFLWHAEL